MGNEQKIDEKDLIYEAEVHPGGTSNTKLFQDLLNKSNEAVFQIMIIDNQYGTGFFTKIKDPKDEDRNMKVLFTCNHVLNKEFLIQKKEIKLSINSNEKILKLQNRRIWSNKYLDYTCIEIVKEDNINYFLNIDDNILNYNYSIENFNKIGIYVFGIMKNRQLGFDCGFIQKFYNFRIVHNCNTNPGCSGGPIINKNNNNIIGIHNASGKNKKYNLGIFIKSILSDIKDNNYMNLENNVSNSNIIQNSHHYGIIISDFHDNLPDKLFDEIRMQKTIDIMMNPYLISQDMLDERGDKNDGWSLNERRGNKPYDPPLGWRGIGLNVIDKYDNGNNIWLGNNNSPGEWCVAYHGAGDKLQLSNEGKKHTNCKDIYHPGKKVGDGVYCTPYIKHAENYAKIIDLNGKKYKMVFMLRIKPEAIRTCNCSNGNEWVINAKSDKIRPYRILIKEYDN